jgi:hypothetical protein
LSAGKSGGGVNWIMITAFDTEYKATKLIKQGKARLKDEFKPLANWIKEAYGAKPLNIIYDCIQHDNLPRLQVIFEFKEDADKFRDGYNFDQVKQQAIAGQFAEIVKSLPTQVRSNFFLESLLEDEGFFVKRISSPVRMAFDFSSGDVHCQTEKLFVYFSAFAPIAKEEANGAIPKQKIELLKNEIADNNLWEISRGFAEVTFFLYKAGQIDEYMKNGVREQWGRKYFELLSRYDEFGYFKKESYYVYLDSKENFDTNYNGNWFYYYK